MLSLLVGSTACVSYGVGAVLLSLRGRRTGLNWLLVLASALTAVWAALFAATEANLTFPAIMVAAARVFRDAGWFAVLIAFLRQDAIHERLWRWLGATAALFIAIELIFTLTGLTLNTNLGVRVTLPITEFGVSVFGLVLVENLLRNLAKPRVWSLKLLVIGLGAVYAYDIALRIPELLAGVSINDFAAAEPLAYVIILPLLIVTAVRNDSLKLQLHSSRAIVFQSATVLFAGVLLQGTAAAAYYLRHFGGTPGVVLTIVLVFTSAVGFIVAISSHSIRSKLRTFINENFYSYKYDYRTEWTRFIHTLSLDQNSGGPERVLRTITNLLDSPGGVLWVRRDGWRQFLPLAHWSLGESFGPIEADDGLVKAFADPAVDFIEIHPKNGTSEEALWQSRFPRAWLAIPMRFKERLIAIALLQKPRAARHLDWEDRNLLKLTTLELGAHLIHEQRAQMLADSQQLAEFNKRVTFAVHDLKNTAGQLTLLARNAERFGENPQFRADMVSTIGHAANNLQNLIEKLNSKGSAKMEPDNTYTQVNICDVLSRFAGKAARRNGNVTFDAQRYRAPIYISLQDPAALDNALEHVIANAIEASPEANSVKLSLDEKQDEVRVHISDSGPGMSMEFIRNELFRPLHTTKSDGMGVGAYQAKTIMSELGGDLEVNSELGIGTTVTLVLPVRTFSAQRSPA